MNVHLDVLQGRAGSG